MSRTEKMSKLTELIEGANTIAIIGHIRPDGDDIGSCLGLYNYIKTNYPHVTKLKVFLEKAQSKFNFMKGMDEVSHKIAEDDKDYDLVICLDCATRDRLGEFGVLLDSAKHSMCVDHHKTNPGYCEFNDIRGGASSTSEVIVELLDAENIDEDAAVCFYTGIAHDIGIFQYSATTSRTMEIGGQLLSTGFPQDKIITISYYQKSYNQIRAWGYAYQNAKLAENGRCIYSIFTWKDMKKFGISSVELDGISSELRNVEGVDFSILLYQDGPNTYKGSMRSSGAVDCSMVAVRHNGGGHARASGCTCEGDPEEIIKTILSEIREQF